MNNLSIEATQTLIKMNDFRTALRASYDASPETHAELNAAGLTYSVGESSPGRPVIAPTASGKALAAKLATTNTK